MVQRDEPASEEEIAELRRLRGELQALLIRLSYEETKLQPGKRPVQDAEGAIALTESAESLASAVDQGRTLEVEDNRREDVTAQEAAAARTAADELQGQIGQFEQDSGLPKGGLEPAALGRAREIMTRLLLMDLRYTLGQLRPLVEELEGEADPPSADELEELQPLVAPLTTAVDALEQDLIAIRSGEFPDELAEGIELIRRCANLSLANYVAAKAPFVESCEEQSGSLSAEQIAELREIPADLRPRLRSARRTMRQDSEDESESSEISSPEITAAVDMLRRVQRLVPDSPVAVEEPVDSPDTQPVVRFFRFYGSLRLRALVQAGSTFELDGQTSRMGVRFEGKLTRKMTGIARAEVGFNFLDEEALTGIGEGRGLNLDTFFFDRLAFIGARFALNEVRFGKQWSAFYDVGVFSDQMPYLAGAGTGVFAARTDGGVSGTGRADDALQYSGAIGEFRYTLQAQIRNETDEDKALADTFGASLTWEANQRVQIGAAYNQVRDGIPDPGIDEPKEGDRAFIVGYRYRTEPLYFGVTTTLFDNHETDDIGVFFGGLGLEAYASYRLTPKLMARGAVSALLPDSDYPGEYRVLTFTSGLNYVFTDKLFLVFLTRLDATRLADGSDRNGSVFSTALFFNF